MLGLFYPYGIVLQAIAITHFVRRRPESFWLWVIIMGGGLGALVYIVVEVIPDVGLLRGAVQVFPRRKRIRYLEAAVLDNPSIGNYEELGDLYLDDGQFAKARACFDRVLSPRTESVDPYYRRALAAMALGDHTAAAADLEQVVRLDPKYDYHRAAGLLAHELGQVGRTDEALAHFAAVTESLDAVGNAVQLRVAARGQRAHRRSEGVGAARPRQEADDAGLHAPAGAAVVPEGRGTLKRLG